MTKKTKPSKNRKASKPRTPERAAGRRAKGSQAKPASQSQTAPVPDETPVQRRRRLRAEARERQRETVPALKAAIRDLKAARRKRRAFCVQQCKRRRRRITSEAQRAREKLRERIARLRDRARQACRACKVRASDTDLDNLDAVLAELASERAAIKRLREQARGLKSSRGRAGGRRAAELRAERLDAVRRDVADDPILLALWERHGSKIKARPRSTLTETFLEWVEEHPEAIEELQRDQERQWAEEAEAMLSSVREASKAKDEAEIARWSRELDEADRWLADEAPAGLSPVPF